MRLRLEHWGVKHRLLWGTIFVAISIATTPAKGSFSGQNVYRFPNARVLAAYRDADHGQVLRVAVDDDEQNSIKYVHLDFAAPHASGTEKSEGTLLDLPLLPPGDWNEAHINIDGDTTTPVITNVVNIMNPEITDSNWYPRKIDYFGFSNVQTLQQDRMQVVTHPDFDTPVLIKIASFPWEIPSMEREAAVYRRLHGSGITPGFLGYVTEHHRAIGFITEYIQQTPSMRNGSIRGCLAALHDLHRRGIAHRDAHDGNCLVRGNGSSVLIDFELSIETRQPEEFERDLDTMDRCIRSTSESF